MPKSAKILKIFVASPHDLSDERNVIAGIIDKINAQNRISRSRDPKNLAPEEILLQLVRWEDCFPDTSPFGAQEVVNRQTEIIKSDIFICMIGSSLGSPTARYRSGTLEEVAIVTKKWARSGSPRLSFWFKPIDPSNPAFSKSVASEIAQFRNEVRAQGSLTGEISSDPKEFLDNMTNAILGLAGAVIDNEQVTSKSAFVFGRGSRNSIMHVVCGGLVLNPILATAIRTDERIGSRDERNRFSRFPMYKKDLKWRYSASALIGTGELRAVSYLMKAFGTPTAPRRLDSVVDVDFSGWASDVISIGAASNTISRQIAEDPTNKLVVPALFKKGVHDHAERFFVSKATGEPVHPKLEKDEDYALIMKIAPTANPDRTWLFCGGLGPWGTSAGAKFLAEKWEQIAKQLKPTTKHFAALIKVKEREDDSGVLQWVVTRPQDLKTFPYEEPYDEFVRWDALPRDPSWLQKTKKAFSRARIEFPEDV